MFYKLIPTNPNIWPFFFNTACVVNMLAYQVGLRNFKSKPRALSYASGCWQCCSIPLYVDKAKTRQA